MLSKLIFYGCTGLLIEVLFTGVSSLLKRNWRAIGVTYLWMLPIYGFGGLLLERLHLFGFSFIATVLLHVFAIYFVEYMAGWALHKLLGRCPWDYGTGRHTIKGYIHLYYAPFWLVLGTLFELYQRYGHYFRNYLFDVR